MRVRNLIGIAAISASTLLRAGGLEQGFVRIWSGKDAKERIPVKAERMPDGAYRYRVKTCDIPRTAKNIDVVPDAAIVPKGEGYWVGGDQRWGRLDRDEK